MFKTLFTFLSFSLILINTCFAQNDTEAISYLVDAKRVALSSYEKLMQDQSGIYNGVEYIEYDDRINGHPFFLTEYYTPSEVDYNGQKYDSVELKYDINKNLLVVEYYDHIGYSKALTLNNINVKSFNIEGHTFIHINDSNSVGSLRHGFYDVIFDNDIQIYVHRKKELFEEIVDLKINKSFLDKDKFYIVRDNGSNEVKGRKAVLKIFADRKKELQKYIKASRLDFKNNFENSLLSVADQYINLHSK